MKKDDKKLRRIAGMRANSIGIYNSEDYITYDMAVTMFMKGVRYAERKHKKELEDRLKWQEKKLIFKAGQWFSSDEFRESIDRVYKSNRDWSLFYPKAMFRKFMGIKEE